MVAVYKHKLLRLYSTGSLLGNGTHLNYWIISYFPYYTG